MKLKLQIMKAELKAQATKIREMKSKRKSMPSGFVFGLQSERWRNRHKHIAYSIILGRQYLEIEPKVRDDNKPDWDLVAKFQREVLGEEAVCANG